MTSMLKTEKSRHSLTAAVPKRRVMKTDSDNIKARIPGRDPCSEEGPHPWELQGRPCGSSPALDASFVVEVSLHAPCMHAYVHTHTPCNQSGCAAVSVPHMQYAQGKWANLGNQFRGALSEYQLMSQ